jgi:hypothetical protein
MSDSDDNWDVDDLLDDVDGMLDGECRPHAEKHRL